MMQCQCTHSIVTHQSSRAIVGACFVPGCECLVFSPTTRVRSTTIRRGAFSGLDPARPAYIAPHWSIVSIEPQPRPVPLESFTLHQRNWPEDIQKLTVACSECIEEVAIVVRVHITRDMATSCPRTFYWWGGDFLDAAKRIILQTYGGTTETLFGITALHEQMAPPHEWARTQQMQTNLRNHPGWYFYGITTGKKRPAKPFATERMQPFAIPGLAPPSKR